MEHLKKVVQFTNTRSYSIVISQFDYCYYNNDENHDKSFRDIEYQ